MPATKLTVSEAVRKVCLELPDTEEVISHGSPDFRVGGKTFATYSVNHHGDGHVALWLRSPPGAQQLYSEMEPEYYFVPPYVGPKGWLGVELNTGLSWPTIAQRVHEAYLEVAPPKQAQAAPSPITITARVIPMTAEEIDPYQRPRAQTIIAALDDVCLALPETNRASLWGSPAWKAGKKTFCSTHHRSGRLQVAIWVGLDAQQMLSMDPRFTIPPYTGKNGWIELDIEDDMSEQEVRSLVTDSYRHFALKRMLKALDSAS